MAVTQNPRKELAKILGKECKSTQDIQDALKELFADVLEQALEAEMEQHLGYPKHSPEGDNSGNSRNGYSTKRVKTRMGETAVAIPRDRKSEFEPQIIQKYERNASELEDQIIACQPVTSRSTSRTSTGSKSPPAL